MDSVSRVRETSAGVWVTSTGSVGPASSAPRVTGVRCPEEIILSLCRGRHSEKEHHFVCSINLYSSDCDLYAGVSGART